MDAGSYSQQVTWAWPDARSWPELRALAERLLAACDARLARELPGWVGHVKALVATDEGAAYASLTGAGEEITWRGALTRPAGRADVTLYAVVWAAATESVAGAVAGALAQVGEGQGGPGPP